MPEDPNHAEEHSAHADAQETEVTSMAIRLPLVILIAVLLMAGAGLLAVLMHG